MPVIRELNADDVIAIPAVDGGPAWHGGPAKWAAYWDEHSQGLRACFVAAEDDRIVGYASLVWRSQYDAFAAAGVPEIQDMVVAEACRGRGVATALAAACEARAVAEGRAEIGIGFGLYAD